MLWKHEAISSSTQSTYLPTSNVIELETEGGSSARDLVEKLAITKFPGSVARLVLLSSRCLCSFNDLNAFIPSSLLWAWLIIVLMVSHSSGHYILFYWGKHDLHVVFVMYKLIEIRKIRRFICYRNYSRTLCMFEFTIYVELAWSKNRIMLKERIFFFRE